MKGYMMPLIISLGDFYRVTIDSEFHYYPTQTTREKIVALNPKNDPPITTGYGVYDLSVSTEYAVELYQTLEEAKAHKEVSFAEVEQQALGEMHPRVDPDFYAEHPTPIEHTDE
jgi:hypothetical protein